MYTEGSLESELLKSWVKYKRAYVAFLENPTETRLMNLTIAAEQHSHNAKELGIPRKRIQEVCEPGLKRS